MACVIVKGLGRAEPRSLVRMGSFFTAWVTMGALVVTALLVPAPGPEVKDTSYRTSLPVLPTLSPA